MAGGLLLAIATTAAAQAPDTVRAEMVLPVPMQVTMQGDTTIVNVNHDSLGLALQMQLDLAIEEARGGGGPPDWFYAGTLVLGVAALLTWASKKTTTVYVNQEQSQDQDQSTEVEETETRFPWCWPPGHCRHGGD